MEDSELTAEMVLVPEADWVEAATDRELLEYIVRHMITPEAIAAQFEKALPDVIAKLDDAAAQLNANPLLKPILRMLKHL